MALRDRAHARRVLDLVSRHRADYLADDTHAATLAWLRAVAGSAHYNRDTNIHAAEIRLALIAPAYVPNESAVAWLRQQARRAPRFRQSKWARHALARIGIEQ